MNKQKQRNTIISIIAVILTIFLLFVAAYFQSSPAVLLSCKEGKFVEFTDMSLPLKMFPPENDCRGEIEITTIDGILICKNKDYTTLEFDSVKIRCKELKEYKEQEVHMEFKTFSSIYGNATGSLNRIFGEK